jgi:dipeptidyl aminopeptidase/acylaminoacyl peptidase
MHTYINRVPRISVLSLPKDECGMYTAHRRDLSLPIGPQLSQSGTLTPMTPRLFSAAATAFTTLLLTATAQIPKSPAQAPHLTIPEYAQISPDAALVAWTIKQPEGSTLHLTTLADPDPAKERLIAPNGATNCSNTAPAWSPDSQTLAFTSTCTGKEEKPGHEQLFLWSRTTGEVKQLTHLTGSIDQAAWSPDGKFIAFLFVENATRQATPLAAEDPAVGVIGEDNVQVQGVFAVDIATGEGAWQIRANPEMYTYEFAWSPNSKDLAWIGAPAPGENNWWVAKLYVAKDLFCPRMCEDSGKTTLVLDPTTTSTALHGLQIAVPRWSPDGKRIAIIGGLMSDQGSTGGDIWVVNADGKSPPTNITPNIDGTPTFEAWINDNTIGLVESRRGHILLPDYNVATQTYVPNSSLDLGEIALGSKPIEDSVSFSDMGGAFAFIKSSFSTPPEVWAGPLDHMKQLTHLNDNIHPTEKTESIEWTNEGLHIQGWLTYPTGYNPKKKYPLVVMVHGGPSSAAGPRASSAPSIWPSHGYFLFQPNPRGSYGQGEKFVQANRKDFGYGDLRDILAGMDAVEAKVSIDKSREGLTGWSYGGFMTMFAITQTHRFRAAIAGAGIADWLSYYGENSIDQWMTPFFGATVYDDPAIYAKSSALTFIKNAKTPTLILVGERDGECPAPQSFEMWHALRAEGVKTQLIVYPNEGHRFIDPNHLQDRDARELKWFEDNMK